MKQVPFYYFLAGVASTLIIAFVFVQAFSPQRDAPLDAPSSNQPLEDTPPLVVKKAEKPKGSDVAEKPITIPASPKPKSTPKEDGPPMHDDYSDPESGLEDLECWADYCPCDTTNPDYGYLDISLCRKIEMGQPISDSEYNLGAMGRDARKALREDQERSGSYYE